MSTEKGTDGVRITLPPKLAAQAGCEDVVVREDDDDLLYVYPASGGDELRNFSWNDYGVIRDLYDRALGLTPAVNAQTMARIGGWKAKEARGRDNQERAPEGAKYEDV